MKDVKNWLVKAATWATIPTLIFAGFGSALSLSASVYYTTTCLVWFLTFVFAMAPKLNRRLRDFDQLYAAVRKIVEDNTEKDHLPPISDLEGNTACLRTIVKRGLKKEELAKILIAERTENERTTEKQFDNLEGIIYGLVGAMMRAIVIVWNRGRGGHVNLTPDQSRNLRRELGREVLRALITIRASEREIINLFNDTRLLSDLVASAVMHRIIGTNSPLFMIVSATDLERKVARETSDVPAEPPPVDKKAELTRALRARQASKGPQDPGRTSSDETDPGDTKP